MGLVPHSGVARTENAILTPIRTFIYYILLAFCLSPILPLAKGWVEIVRAKSKFEIADAVLLLLVTASFGWIVLGLAFPLTIGRFHYGAIGCNGILMLFIAVATVIKKKSISTLVLAAALTFLVWDYLGIIHSVAV
jgi:hypothetical protein